MFVRQLTHVRLDRLRLAALPAEVLRQLPAATHLYAQHNRLDSTASAAAALPRLRFLALGHNRIEKVGRGPCPRGSCRRGSCRQLFQGRAGMEPLSGSGG